MKSLMSRLFLALALLLSQTAVAMHDIHCLEGEHDQLCEIYFTQDHSASNDIDSAQLERAVYVEKSDEVSALVPPLIYIFFCLSRAPPQFI